MLCEGSTAVRETKLPRELEDALRNGDIERAKRLFSLCEPNAVRIHSNVFSLTPMPKEFALWAKERGGRRQFQERIRTDPPLRYRPHGRRRGLTYPVRGGCKRRPERRLYTPPLRGEPRAEESGPNAAESRGGHGGADQGP